MPEPISVAVFLGGLFIGSFLPSYVSRKGKNQADKEDISKITDLIEESKKKHTKEVETLKSSLQINSQNSIALRKEKKIIMVSFFKSCDEYLSKKSIKSGQSCLTLGEFTFEEYISLVEAEESHIKGYISNRTNMKIYAHSMRLKTLCLEIRGKSHELSLYVDKDAPLGVASEDLSKKIISFFDFYYYSFVIPMVKLTAYGFAHEDTEEKIKKLEDKYEEESSSYRLEAEESFKKYRDLSNREFLTEVGSTNGIGNRKKISC